jgi:6-phosphogluconolactonase
MKFSKFGQVSLALVVSLAICFGITSCSNAFSVAFLYVTGVQFNQIGGFKVDNDTGNLSAISKSPFASGGTNPVRMIKSSDGRFLYVLNQDPTGQNSNISLLSVGGNGILTFQAKYTSQGTLPLNLGTDAAGTHLFVLDTYAPTGPTTAAAPSASAPCIDNAGAYHPVGDITAFTVDATTGRLSLITNQQQQNSDGTQLTYFPVGCLPIDFKTTSAFIYTVDNGSPVTPNHPIADLQTVFVYAFSGATGQLTLTQNAPLATLATQISTIAGDSAGRYIYVLDAGANQILPYTIGSNGALQTLVGGNVPNQAGVSNPVALIVDSKGKSLYVANAGPNNGTTNAASGISAWTISPTNGQLTPIGGSPYGTGSGPRCILEDPSNQYLYTANFNDSTVTGRIIDTNTGELTQLRKGSSFATVGNPTWCVASGRTQ